jgi:mannitol/fructose-specific phosphotransferase system IIA component (Ntr-type)
MVHDVSLGFLAPVFFVTAGFKVNIAVLWTDTAFLGVIIFVALVTKVLGTWLFYLPTRNGWREGLVIGLGMNGRGAVEIIIAEIGLQMGLINQTMFSVLVFMAFFTTALEPVFLKAGAHWLRKRRLLVRGDDQRKLTLIAGASPLARQLARDLAGGEQVCLLDSNANLIQAATMEGLNAMKGNVLNEDFFDVAGAAQAETLIAMTANQEVNRIAATQARNIFGVPEAWTWPVEAPLTTGPHPEAGEILTVSLTAWNEWITRKEVEAVRFSMIRALPVSTFQALVSVLQLMPLVVEREGRRYPAMTIDGLLRGDEVYGLRRLSVAGDQADLFEELMSACPVMDMAGPTTAEEVFRIAGEKLSPLAGVSAAEISGKLMAREKENTTVIAPGLAIPHITLGGDQPVSLLLVRTRDGATYLDPGQRPVQTTLVIAGSRETRSLHLRIISAIAQLYQRPGFEDMLLAARDTEAIRQVVLNMRRRL